MSWKKLFNFIIHSNIYIALAAIALTLETQIQLGMEPQVHPYIWIIFFATLLEYNFHRLITLLKRKEVLKEAKYNWLCQHTKLFYGLMIFSLMGFVVSLMLAKIKVIALLLPLGVITVFYSLPIGSYKHKLFRLREISVLKIFLIALVWAFTTVLIPVMQSELQMEASEILFVFFERMLFVFAITLPFDIRDMDSDRRAGLKTIPILVGEKKSIQLSVSVLLFYGLIGGLQCMTSHQEFLLPAIVLSVISTIFFVTDSRVKKLKEYHYGVLDGTMLLQGLLLLATYYVNTYLSSGGK